jgi:cytochrome c553
MRNLAGLITCLCLVSGLATGGPAEGADAPPAWAYPVTPPGAKPDPDDGVLRHVPNSEATFTVTQIRDPFFSPDWHPGDHPPMPDIVAQGRRPAVLACGFCHRADGAGGPENARVAGLPAVYIEQQLADFSSGARKTSAPERLAPKYMIFTAKGLSRQDVKAVEAYFASIKPRASVRVVESETVPKTKVEGERLALAGDNGTEAIGQRIIEVPENETDFTLRDGRARFVAYVPPGSLKAGQVLVATGNEGTVSCTLCHGADLHGSATIPGIAGLSPSYIVRQLYDFQSGARAGGWSEPMVRLAQKLSLDDMIALAAYAASLSP